VLTMTDYQLRVLIKMVIALLEANKNVDEVVKVLQDMLEDRE
jgi:pentatricopeptide repeat protein